MIPENVTPALYGKVPPASSDDAANRINELIPLEGVDPERFVGVVFNNVEEIAKAFRECGFLVSTAKKPIVNLHSKTEWLHLIAKKDGQEVEILINTMGYSTIINAVTITKINYTTKIV